MPTSPTPSVSSSHRPAEDRAARAPRRRGSTRRAVGDTRGAQPAVATSGRQRRRARDVRVHRLRSLHRALDDDHGRDQTEVDFRQVVVSYAEEAAAHGAVYIEGIFTPAERISGGASWDEVFTGFCDGAAEAKEQHGVEMRLTPDIPRGFGLEAAMQTVRYAIKYRDRGVVAVGLGGREAEFPPEPFERAFRAAKDGGLGSVPHAGEAAGPESIRSAIEVLHADRIRHGVRGRGSRTPARARGAGDRV